MVVSAEPNVVSKKLAAALLTSVMVVLVVSPVFRSPPTDSFPLSTFPMFSDLVEPVVAIDVVVGIDTTGASVSLGPRVIAGTDEVIIAGSIVRQAVRGGAASAAQLCDDVVSRVGADKGLTAIEVRTETVDAIAWFSGSSQPLSTQVHHRCALDNTEVQR